MSSAVADLIVEGEIVEREIPGVGLLRFEDLGPGEWLTQRGEPAKKARRRYLLDGEELISVSQITGTLEKPALYAWYEDHGARGGAEAQRRGELDRLKPHEIIRKVRALELGAEKQRDEAAERGKAIHTAFETLALTGTPPKLSDYPREWYPWLQGAARAWLLMDPEPEEVEQMVCNPAYRFAGRPDQICRIGGRRTLIDYKTGKGRIYEQAHYQTRLYETCLEPSGIEPVEDIIIVGISDEGQVELVHCEASELEALGLLTVHLSSKRICKAMAAQRAEARRAA
jgi:hypothetical protein